MAQFMAPAPDVKARGEGVLSFVEGCGAFKYTALRVLGERGIPDPTPGEWYPQQAFLDALKAISGEVGPAGLYLIGTRALNGVAWLAEVDSVESGLAVMDTVYQAAHQGGRGGHYRAEQTGRRSATVVCTNPYPCNLDRGICFGVAARFAPPGASVQVVHDASAPCRTHGADSCTYVVPW